MKRQVFGTFVVLLACVGIVSVAQAQYERRTSASQDRSSSENNSFDESVDPENFRHGNFEWDTQELIAGGFKALHQDHEKILRDLADVKASLKKLESQR